ncbi:hypothetical protein HAP48_0001100 (plasmid) [Bradyrhizobium septentrionale]|uniref:Uncharacterized protein n=1 Tax=Bradyrhizobium septentrionale TaxID=1404411 RepID=A0A973WAN3_9BRAD|nr:hypothetical protein [Bradyrhizobium septentrionale]UGY11750.1 hypothetical protein HAP48_0001100 [Bradyrhizobium septentrionale]UGY29963.1 hypothetical protein HU675_0048485 [Bradyrhizobium septentrionale]
MVELYRGDGLFAAASERLQSSKVSRDAKLRFQFQIERTAQPDPHKACALYDVGGEPVIKEKGKQGQPQLEIAPYPSSLRGRRLEPASQALVKFHERLAARLDSEIALAPVEQDLLDFLNGIRLSPSMMAQACRQNATMRAPLGLDTVGRAPPPIPDALSFALYCNALLSICAPEADQMNTQPTRSAHREFLHFHSRAVAAPGAGAIFVQVR